MAVFEAAMLPTSVKEQLCLELLEEFGAVSIRHRPVQQELTHGCLINPEQHGDQTRNPTASLNYAKLTYKCLGCNAKGGLLWLICQVRGCELSQAREWLAKETGTGGVVMPLQQLLDYYDALYADAAQRPAPIPQYSAVVLEPWLGVVHPWLTTGVPDLEIQGRGIPEQNVLDLKLGWDASEDRIVIPHFWKDRLVGWQKRRLSGTGPKYESTPDMPKDQTLYDYDAKRRTAVIVESPMSVARHRHAIPMEATFGSAVTDRQIRLIAAHYERCILWMDNDKAGWLALEGIENAPGMIERLSQYCPVWVADSPFAGDPADLDTGTAELVLERFLTPASVWTRPQVLLCPQCRDGAHRGPCQAESDQKEDAHAA
jgi:hypothetical protein